MDRGAWWGTVCGVAKESDVTWQLNNNKMPNQTLRLLLLFLFTHFVFSSSILFQRLFLLIWASILMSSFSFSTSYCIFLEALFGFHHSCCFLNIFLSFFFFNFILFNFTILYWFCHISKWIRHRYTCVPHPEPSSLLPPHTIPLGCPSAPAPSIQYRASNLDWRLVSYMILYIFQCHSSKSSHPLPLPQRPKDCSIHLCLFCVSHTGLSLPSF